MGKKGSSLRVNGELRELSPASGEFRIAPDRFIELVGEALMAFSKVEPRTDGGTTDMEAEVKAPADTEASEKTTEETEGGMEGDGASQGKGTEGVFRRVLVGRPEGTTFQILGGIFRRPAVRFSVARKEEGEIRERTAGTISAERALVLMDMAGAILKKGRYMRPLSVAALFCEAGRVVFMFGNRETGLTEWQQRELKYILSLRFLGDTRPIRFRAGRFSLVEEDGRFTLRFGRNRHEISPGDLAVIRAILI